MPHFVLVLITALMLLPALGLVFIPMLPAIPYMFLVTLCFGLLDGFVHVTPFDFWIFGGIVVLSILIDQLSGIIGAKYGGASRKAMLFGFVGGFIGVIVLPPFGALLGVFAGVLLSELLLNKSRRDAIRAATGAIIGSAAGIATNFFLAILFLILFLVFAFS